MRDIDHFIYKINSAHCPCGKGGYMGSDPLKHNLDSLFLTYAAQLYNLFLQLKQYLALNNVRS